MGNEHTCTCTCRYPLVLWEWSVGLLIAFLTGHVIVSKIKFKISVVELIQFTDHSLCTDSDHIE